MGLVGPVQATADPFMSFVGSTATGGETDAGDQFSALFLSLAAGASTGDAANGPVASAVADFPFDPPEAEESDTDVDVVAVATLATVIPVPAQVQTLFAPVEAAGHADDSLAVMELPDVLAGLLEEMAAEADLAEPTNDGGTVDASAILEIGDDAFTTLSAAPADVEGDTSSIPAEGAGADGSPDEPPGLRALDLTEAPPDAPPDETGAAETSVVRPVGNAQEAANAVEDAVEPAPVPDLQVLPTETAAAEDSPLPETLNAVDVQARVQAPVAGGSAPPGATVPEPIRMEGQPLARVADAVVEHLDSEGGEARIILDPPELGEIIIKLHARGEHVSIEVTAQRHEAIQMLRDGSPSLASLLHDRGLDLGTAQFTLSQQGQQGGDQQAGEHGPNNSAGTGFGQLLGFDEPGEAVARNHNKLRAAYNPDGDFAYRV